MNATKTSKTIELFTIIVPCKTTIESTKQYNFTTHNAQVVTDGVVYIPLSVFDQARWAELCKES